VAARDAPRQRLVGIDTSDKFLAVAQRDLRSLGAELHKRDIACTGFRDGDFDAIICAGVIDTVPNPSQPLVEFNRLLSEGGDLLLVMRPGDSRMSRSLETVFRLLAGLGNVWTTKSLNGLRVPADLWERSAILPKLGELLLPTDLSIVTVEQNRVWTVARLTKVLTSTPN
jgi:SAM-dependent methyltransferase